MKNISKQNQIDLDFYSEEMIVSEKFLNQHQLKWSYQRQLISNLDSKHKEWSKIIPN